MRKLSHCISALILITSLACWLSLPCRAQSGEFRTSSIEPSLILLQSEIAGQKVTGTACIVKSGDPSLALTSYEAIRGASSIKALIPNKGMVIAHLSKFAEETNIALLEIPVANLPAVKLGDYDSLRPKTPINLLFCNPIFDGDEAVAQTNELRIGALQSTINRPSGAILRIGFNPGISDATTGAPIIIPNTGEVVAIALSLELSQVETLRFAVPSKYVGALCPELSIGDELSGYVKVKDGSEAVVYKNQNKKGKDSGTPIWMYLVFIGIPIGIIALIYVKTRPRKAKIVPFSKLPALPEGVDMAFVTAEGEILKSDTEVITIGRAEDNTWVFKDATVSNHHARIRKNRFNKNYEIEDRKSTNGTFVGKRRIVSAETITPGSKVRFGKKIEVMLMMRSQSTEAPQMQLNIKKIQR